MRWFRTHIGLGSCLALFALAVQLVLSFDHVHVTNLGQTQAVSRVAGGVPGPNSGGPADHGCAICGLIQLAATATPSAAPALPQVLAPGYTRLLTADQFLAPASPEFPFRARAPPVG